MTEPVFIISLPRSGSTLLQRLLTSHDDFVGYSEPSLLLKLFGGGEGAEQFAVYGYNLVLQAEKDLEEKYGNYKEVYNRNIGEGVLKIYAELAQGKRFFVDKTPRYTLILNEMTRVFPDAKYIFLWRHPGGVLNSIANTWNNGRWDDSFYRMDLSLGVKNMQEAYMKLAGNALSLRYEDLVNDPKKELVRIEKFLNVDGLVEKLDRDLPETHARLGDPNAMKKYKRVDGSSTGSWVKNCNNIIRRRMLVSLYNEHEGVWIEKGYDLKTLEASHKFGGIGAFKDGVHIVYSSVKMLLNIKVFRLMFLYRRGIRSSFDVS